LLLTTLDFLNEAINVPVEIEGLNIFVKVINMLGGRDFNKNDGISSTPELYFDCKFETVFCISFGDVG